MFVTAFVFIIILGLLIFIHELGHFIVAKLAGIKVEEFAFGFPPRIVSKTFNGTKYALNLIPIGGYVKLLGEDEKLKDKRAFSAKPVAARLMVVAAGVLMNYLLAIVVFSIGFGIGITPYFTDPQSLGGQHEPLVLVSRVFDNSPADKAGLRAGEQIADFTSAQALQEFTLSHASRQVVLRVIDENAKDRQISISLEQGPTPLGVALFETAIIKLPFAQAILAGAKEATNAARFTMLFFAHSIERLFSLGEVPEEIGGPVAIFGATAQAVSQGFSAVLRTIGILSINLAILNAVPFPALDGGKALFIGLEGIFGKRVIKEHHESIIHTVGFILLLVLIVAITYRDILRLR